MASTKLYYLNQFVTTTLSVIGGIDDTQTTGIVVQSTSGLDTTKAGIALLSYADPLSTTTAEWVTYTSITAGELQGVTRGAEGYSAKAHTNGVAVAFPISESHVNNLNAMFDTVGLDMAEISTPANPDAGRNKIYFKNDDKLYKLTSGGTETEIGAGITTRYINLGVGDFYTGTTTTPGQGSANGGNTSAWLFDAAATEDVYATFVIPTDYAGGAMTPKWYWSMESATSGNVVLQLQVGSITDGVAISSSTDLLNHQQTVAVPGVADTVELTTFNTFTPTAGSMVRFRVLRLGADGSDTATGDMVFYGCRIEYTSTL